MRSSTPPFLMQRASASYVSGWKHASFGLNHQAPIPAGCCHEIEGPLLFGALVSVSSMRATLGKAKREPDSLATRTETRALHPAMSLSLSLPLSPSLSRSLFLPSTAPDPPVWGDRPNGRAPANCLCVKLPWCWGSWGTTTRNGLCVKGTASS